MSQFDVDETTLVFAFRYALGRSTGAVSHMVGALKEHWPQLADWTQQQIRGEITRAIERGDAGQRCDVRSWREILALPTVGRVDSDECPGCGRRAVMCLCSHADADDGCCGPGGGNSHS